MTLPELKLLAQQLGWPLLMELHDAIAHLDQQNTGNAERLARAMEREEALKADAGKSIGELREKLSIAEKTVRDREADVKRLNATIDGMSQHPDVKAARREALAHQIRQLALEHDSLIEKPTEQAE